MIMRGDHPLKVSCVCTQPVSCGCEPTIDSNLDVTSLSTSALNFEFTSRNQVPLISAAVAVLVFVIALALFCFKCGKRAQRRAVRRSARFEQMWSDARDVFSPRDRNEFYAYYNQHADKSLSRLMCIFKLHFAETHQSFYYGERQRQRFSPIPLAATEAAENQYARLTPRYTRYKTDQPARYNRHGLTNCPA